MYKDLTIFQYFNEVARKSSTPSGGSVLALVNEASASLLLMVIAFTIEKKGYEIYHDDLINIRKEIEDIKDRCHDYIDEDAEVFSLLMKAMKRKDQEEINYYSLKAVHLSMDLYDIAIKLKEYAYNLKKKGNKNLLSDADIALSLSDSTLEGSLKHIELNGETLKEEDKKEVNLFLERIKHV